METKQFVKNAKWEPVQIVPCSGWVAVYDEDGTVEGLIVDPVCCWAIIRIWDSKKDGREWRYVEPPRLEVVGLSAESLCHDLQWSEAGNFLGYCLAGQEASLLPKGDDEGSPDTRTLADIDAGTDTDDAPAAAAAIRGAY